MPFSRANAMLHTIGRRIVDGDVEKIAADVSEALHEGTSTHDILKAIREGAESVGKRYEIGEIFLTDLMLSGAAMQEALKVLEPAMQNADHAKLGTIVVGSVEGDLHDIGKNIFKSLALGAGFDVVDLGVDTSADRFVATVAKSKPQIIGISALLSTTMSNMRKVIQGLDGANLRGKVRVILGGPGVSEEYAKGIHADAGVDDAVEGVGMCKRWIQE